LGCSETVGRRSLQTKHRYSKDVYETAERYKDLTEVAMIALKTRSKVTNAATITQSAS